MKRKMEQSWGDLVHSTGWQVRDDPIEDSIFDDRGIPKTLPNKDRVELCNALMNEKLVSARRNVVAVQVQMTLSNRVKKFYRDVVHQLAHTLNPIALDSFLIPEGEEVFLFNYSLQEKRKLRRSLFKRMLLDSEELRDIYYGMPSEISERSKLENLFHIVNKNGVIDLDGFLTNNMVPAIFIGSSSEAEISQYERFVGSKGYVDHDTSVRLNLRSKKGLRVKNRFSLDEQSALTYANRFFLEWDEEENIVPWISDGQNLDDLARKSGNRILESVNVYDFFSGIKQEAVDLFSQEMGRFSTNILKLETGVYLVRSLGNDGAIFTVEYITHEGAERLKSKMMGDLDVTSRDVNRISTEFQSSVMPGWFSDKRHYKRSLVPRIEVDGASRSYCAHWDQGED